MDLWTSPPNKEGLHAAGPLGLLYSLVTVFLRVSQQIQERKRQHKLSFWSTKIVSILTIISDKNENLRLKPAFFAGAVCGKRRNLQLRAWFCLLLAGFLLLPYHEPNDLTQLNQKAP